MIGQAGKKAILQLLIFLALEGLPLKFPVFAKEFGPPIEIMAKHPDKLLIDDFHVVLSDEVF